VLKFLMQKRRVFILEKVSCDNVINIDNLVMSEARMLQRQLNVNAAWCSSWGSSACALRYLASKNRLQTNPTSHLC